MVSGRESDRKMLLSMSPDIVVELLFTHLRNLYAVDGLYFLGIEKRHGTSAATEIDREVWEQMGVIEARRLKKMNIGGDGIPGLMSALRLTSWALDIEDKEIEVSEDRGLIRNRNCRVQNTRLIKGLSQFLCKDVRLGFMEAFVRELNPDVEVKCNVCPPDEHPNDLWCEWEFSPSKR